MIDRTGPRHDLAAAAAAGGSQSNKIKLAVAVVGLVIAGVLLANYFGVFSKGSKDPIKRTPEEIKQREADIQEQDELRQEMEDDPTIEIGGA